jgi:hypothetical protein
MAELTIGRLAARTGVNIETIRYYERIGMIPPPPRSAGGQRRYEESHLRRLCFVRRCRELGFPLEEIRALLTLVDGGDYSCAEVRDSWTPCGGASSTCGSWNARSIPWRRPAPAGRSPIARSSIRCSPGDHDGSADGRYQGRHAAAGGP